MFKGLLMKQVTIFFGSWESDFKKQTLELLLSLSFKEETCWKAIGYPKSH